MKHKFKNPMIDKLIAEAEVIINILRSDWPLELDALDAREQLLDEFLRIQAEIMVLIKVELKSSQD